MTLKNNSRSHDWFVKLINYRVSPGKSFTNANNFVIKFPWFPNMSII